jgi:hypothetical protein
MLVFACATAVLLAGFYVLTPLFKESEGNLEAELWTVTDMDRRWIAKPLSMAI